MSKYRLIFHLLFSSFIITSVIDIANAVIFNIYPDQEAQIQYSRYPIRLELSTNQDITPDKLHQTATISPWVFNFEEITPYANVTELIIDTENDLNGALRLTFNPVPFRIPHENVVNITLQNRVLAFRP